MPFDTSDTRDIREATDAAQESSTATKRLSATGIRAMQGETDAPAAYPDHDPADDPQSFTDEDILLRQIEQLRKEEEESAHEDAARLKEKFPKPAWKS